MKKIIVLFALLGILAVPLFAQNAVVREVSGKVEIKQPQKGWETAAVGMGLPKGATISTGFNSRAVLEVGPSIIRVRPLTRMQLEELIQKEGTVTTALNLPIGRVRSEVKSAAGLKTDFRLRSPVSTAAVRGTTFEFSGFRLEVEDGLVALANLLNQQRSLAGGEDGSTTGYDELANGEGAKAERVVVSISAGRGGIPTERKDDFTGGIVIKY